MKVKLITAVAMLWTSTIAAADKALVSSDPALVTKVIKKLTPSVKESNASVIAKLIHEYAVKHQVDWRPIVAIFKQESNFDLEAVNYVSRDFGIGQLNYKTILNRKVSLARLLTEYPYAIEETFLIIAELCMTYDRIDRKAGRYCYTRYHSFVPSIRDKYREALKKHLSKIEEVLDAEKKESSQRDKGAAGSVRAPKRGR